MDNPMGGDHDEHVIDLVAAEEAETVADLVVLHDELWKAVNALDALWGQVESVAMQYSIRGVGGQGLRSTLDAFAATRALATQINEARGALTRARDYIDVSWVAAEAMLQHQTSAMTERAANA